MYRFTIKDMLILVTVVGIALTVGKYIAPKITKHIHGRYNSRFDDKWPNNMRLK